MDYSKNVAVDYWGQTYTNIESDIRKGIESITQQPRAKFSEITPTLLPNESEIKFSFGDIVITGTANDKLEFNIYAQSSELGSKYGESDILIDYDESYFGSFLAAAGKIQINKELITTDPSYVLKLIDESADRLRISVENNSITNLHTISGSKEKLLKIALDLPNQLGYGDVSFNESLMQNQSDFVDQNNTYEKYETVIAQDSIGENAVSDVPSIKYTFENPKVTGTATKYFEFDVFCQKLTGINTSFRNTAIIVNYNTSTFGTNVSANGKVTLSDGTINGNNGYGYSHMDNPLSSFTIDIINDTVSNTTTLYTLTSTPVQLVHVKIELQATCEEDPVGLSFGSLVMQGTSQYCEFLLGACSPIVYFPVDADDTENFTACSANITFTPSRVSGGVRDVLTIYPPIGQGFGPFGPNCIVEFTPASGSSFEGNNSQEVIEGVEEPRMIWMDQEIKMYVPGKLGSGTPPGTGKIRVVRNDTTMKLTSAGELEVWFNVDGHDVNAPVAKSSRYFHANMDGSGGAPFHKGGGFISSPEIDLCIENAIDQWRCTTGINFTKGSDLPSYGNNASDGKNVIFSFPDIKFNQDSTITAFTFRTFRHDFCYDGQTPNVRRTYISDIDIGFNPTPLVSTPYTWNYSPNYDSIGPLEMHFLSVLRHEFGHAAGLGHVKEPYKIMYHTQDRGQVAPAIFHQSDVDGVCNIKSFTSTIGGNLCTGKTMSYLNPTGCTPCSGTISTFDLDEDILDFTIFPNPIYKGQDITIEFELESETQIEIALYSFSGIELAKQHIGLCTKGDYSHVFKIPFHVPAGIHSISIRNGTTITSEKIMIYD